MPDTALWTDPFTHIKGEVFYDMLAIMAGFAGGIPTVDLMRVRPYHWLL